MSENSSFPDQQSCGDSINQELIGNTFLICKFFGFVPLSIFILCLGYQRWRRSSQSSHSDVFTYNSATLQVLYGLSAIIYISGHYSGLLKMKLVGNHAVNILIPGEINLHILTCMDQYLAVVHPIFYIRSKQPSGIRIRNALIVCVWLICFGWVGLLYFMYPSVPYAAYFSLLAFSVISVSFCSISVLCVLIQPGPGKGGMEKDQSKSKRRAFLTITAILGALLIYFLFMTVALISNSTNLLSRQDACLFLMSSYMVGIPSSLVLPLLFLRKTKKLQCCMCSKHRRLT